MTNPSPEKNLLDTPADALERLYQAISHDRETGWLHQPVMIGIHTGGVWIAEQMHQRLGLEEPLGSLDISFYRDDFDTAGLHPTVRPSHLPFSIEGRDVILVDDVLYTGRTVRAALNEIFDYGRPNKVGLAVLYQRDGRELPICAQWAGQNLTLPLGTHIKLTGPTPLAVSLQSEQNTSTQTDSPLVSTGDHTE